LPTFGNVPDVARVLIVEPHADVRALLEIVVTRLGHEAVVQSSSELDRAVDAAIIEPGEGFGLEVAQRLHDFHVPLVFASIYPPSNETVVLAPVAYLVKPFALYALEHALEDALAETPAAV